MSDNTALNNSSTQPSIKLISSNKTNNNQINKRLLIALPILIALYGIVEFSIYYLLNNYFDKNNFATSSEFVITPKDLTKNIPIFHFKFGWLFNAPQGEKPRYTNFATTKINTFGNSFVQGSGSIPESKTWQSLLASKLKSNVLNFGQPGYGLDQTLLMYSHKSPPHPEYVVLGLTSEMINRNVNVYRRFYLKTTGLALTKPRYEIKHGKLYLYENPIKNTYEYKKLMNESELTRIGKNDWWFNRRDLPKMQFPFTSILFNKDFWSLNLLGYSKDKLKPLPSRDLWKNNKAVSLYFMLLDEFYHIASEREQKMIVVLFPTEKELLSRKKKGISKAENTIINHCRSKKLVCVNLFQEIASKMNSHSDLGKFMLRGFPSTETNSILSSLIFDEVSKSAI